jgi:hypothetical protein
MSDIRTLKLQLLADTAQFSTGLNKASTETKSFTGKLDKIIATAAKAFVGLATAVGTAAFAIGKSAVSAASDFSEEVSKSKVIFGEASKEVEDFAKTAASSLGQSRKQAVAAASTFATLGKAAGLTGKDLSKFSIGFVKLASDLASFNNTSPEDAIQAIGAALRGEAEPIRRYGILLNDATLKNEALALGLIKTTKEALSPANKVLAAQQAIYKQTSDAQGDFARTSEGLANSQRILAANIEDVKITLGESLLPTILKVSDFVKKEFVPAIEGLVNGLTRSGKQSLTRAFYDVSTGTVTFGYDMESTEGKAYELGEQIRQLADAINKLLAIDPNTGESLLIKLIDSLTKIIEKTEAAVRAYERFKESFVGGAILDISTAPIRSVGAALTGNPGQIVNNFNFGATNSKSQAKTVVKSINNAAKAGTVNKFVKPMIPGR